jgi:hypothetical protein
VTGEAEAAAQKEASAQKPNIALFKLTHSNHQTQLVMVVESMIVMPLKPHVQ